MEYRTRPRFGFPELQDETTVARAIKNAANRNHEARGCIRDFLRFYRFP